ncbi:hypothetical protein B0H14DRAFT_3157474 [Mycena olivaceomarginata]|nr:hypothetical protein B0H14DRAFT_3157474 [Mycena olivaceomarginata]
MIDPRGGCWEGLWKGSATARVRRGSTPWIEASGHSGAMSRHLPSNDSVATHGGRAALARARTDFALTERRRSAGHAVICRYDPLPEDVMVGAAEQVLDAHVSASRSSTAQIRQFIDVKRPRLDAEHRKRLCRESRRHRGACMWAIWPLTLDARREAWTRCIENDLGVKGDEVAGAVLRTTLADTRGGSSARPGGRADVADGQRDLAELWTTRSSAARRSTMQRTRTWREAPPDTMQRQRARESRLKSEPDVGASVRRIARIGLSGALRQTRGRECATQQDGQGSAGRREGGGYVVLRSGAALTRRAVIAGHCSAPDVWTTAERFCLELRRNVRASRMRSAVIQLGPGAAASGARCLHQGRNQCKGPSIAAGRALRNESASEALVDAEPSARSALSKRACKLEECRVVKHR